MIARGDATFFPMLNPDWATRREREIG